MTSLPRCPLVDDQRARRQRGQLVDPRERLGPALGLAGPQGGVADDDDVGPIRWGGGFHAGGHGHRPAGQDSADLAAPVFGQVRLARDDQRECVIGGGRGAAGDGLAQPHLVADDQPPPGHGVADGGVLVRQQRHAQARDVHRRSGPGDRRGEVVGLRAGLLDQGGACVVVGDQVVFIKQVQHSLRFHVQRPGPHIPAGEHTAGELPQLPAQDVADPRCRGDRHRPPVGHADGAAVVGGRRRGRVQGGLRVRGHP